MLEYVEAYIMVAGHNETTVQDNAVFDKNVQIIFKNKNFIFTGKLRLFTNEQAELLVKERGGAVQSGISSIVDYVVIGEFPEEVRKNYKLNSKLKNSLTLREKGIDIFIITEDDFAKALAEF